MGASELWLTDNPEAKIPGGHSEQVGQPCSIAPAVGAPPSIRAAQYPNRVSLFAPDAILCPEFCPAVLSVNRKGLSGTKTSFTRFVVSMVTPNAADLSAWQVEPIRNGPPEFSGADDAILGCCLYMDRNEGEAVLLTNDVALQLKVRTWAALFGFPLDHPSRLCNQRNEQPKTYELEFVRAWVLQTPRCRSRCKSGLHFPGLRNLSSSLCEIESSRDTRLNITRPKILELVASSSCYSKKSKTCSPDVKLLGATCTDPGG